MSKTVFSKFGGDDIYGAFNDIASFRAETGLSAAEISDEEVHKVMYDDIKYQKELEEKRRNEAEQEKRQMQQQLNNQFNVGLDRDRIAREASQLRQQYQREKGKRQLFESILDPYHFADPIDAAAKYITKEKIKREIKRELDDQGWNWGETKPRKRRKTSTRKPKRKKSKSRSRSRSKSKRKPKRKKSKSRSRSRSKSKRKSSKSKKGGLFGLFSAKGDPVKGKKKLSKWANTGNSATKKKRKLKLKKKVLPSKLTGDPDVKAYLKK